MRLTLTIVAMLLVTRVALAQHLWWSESGKMNDATCLYGEVTVLVSSHAIYYCGANWHPGGAAGGYCGIQHNSPSERRTIFSIWDTSKELHPHVSQADPFTIHNRFGGEGEGSHTHMLWNWKEGDTFRYFVQKVPGSQPDTTDTRYYVVDPDTRQWRHSATITSPNGDEKQTRSVTTIGGGGLASFLENFAGKNKELPKIALYRLWMGPDVESLKSLTRAGGDGIWGQLNGAYFLAEGDQDKLDAEFARLREKYGEPAYGNKGTKLDPIKERPLTAELIQELKKIPPAPDVKEKQEDK